MSTDEQERSPEKNQKAFLLANIDADYTSAVLLKSLAGRMNVVAGTHLPSTHGPPRDTIIHGLVAAGEKLDTMVGHDLVSLEGDLIRETRQPGRGVSHLALTAMPLRPLRVVLLAERADEPAFASARRVITGICGDIVGYWPAENEDSWKEQLERFMAFEPDIALIVGGHDSQAEELLQDLSHRLRLGLRQFEIAPVVIYAGAESAQKYVQAGLGGDIELLTVPDLRPQRRQERPGPLLNLLQNLVRNLGVEQLPGMREVMAWGQTKPLTTYEAQAAFVGYRSRLQNGGVLLAAATGRQVTLVLGRAGRVEQIVRRDLGLGTPLAQLLKTIPAAEILNWVPEATGSNQESEALQQFLCQQALFPGTVPQSVEEGQLLTAVLRAMISAAAAPWQAENGASLSLAECYVAGSLLRLVPDRRRLVQLLLDGLQPFGVFPVIFDEFDLAAGLGTLAQVDAESAVQAAQSPALAPSFWVVAPGGSGREGKAAVTVELAPGRTDEYQWGSLALITPTAELTGPFTAQPARGGQFGESRGKNQKMTRSQGCPPFEIVIDCRGRPLNLPEDADKRMLNLERWQRALHDPESLQQG